MNLFGEIIQLFKKKASLESQDFLFPRLVSANQFAAFKPDQRMQLVMLTVKGNENNGVQIKPGIFTTNIGAALYKWGQANFDLGVNTVQEAFSIFAEFKGRELNFREKEYIKEGFGKEFEK